MLVDDSNLIQKTSVRSFRNEGIFIDLAKNGLQCLDMVECGAYKLILMDIQMPVMDGLEATRRLRKQESERTHDLESGRHPLVIVGLSANSDSETIKEAMEAGMNGFLPKPLKLSALRECLSRIGCTVLEDHSPLS